MEEENAEQEKSEEEEEEENINKESKDIARKNEEVSQHIIESHKSIGESSYGDDVLKGLLSKKIIFQLVIPLELLQLPMNQGYVDMNNISLVHKFVLGNLFHAFNKR